MRDRRSRLSYTPRLSPLPRYRIAKLSIPVPGRERAWHAVQFTAGIPQAGNGVAILETSRATGISCGFS